MRKNFIVWFRTPACSFFEIAAPVVLMAALWIIRVQVPTVSVDKDGVLARKYPVYLGATPVQGGWTYNNDPLSAIMQDFMTYSNYSDYKHDPPGSWDAGYDIYNPQWYGPGHCIQRLDYDRPKQTSPYIAIIGNQTNITDSITSYMTTIRDIQVESGQAIVRLGLPNYTPVYYSTIQEFESYISSPDYKTDKKHRGICFGIQQYSDGPKNYTFSIHFPDKKIGLRQVGFDQGVPDQSNPVWLPYISQPDMYSYLRYQHQGFAFMQNSIAHQIYANYAENPMAWIGFMLQPMQTETSVFDPLQDGLALLLPLFLLLAYIPPVYNMTFKIVREKESRTKETMRIMGMTDLPYWMSWLVFYSVVNTVVSTLAWAMLLPKVITYSRPFYLWLFFWLYGEAVFGQIIFLQSMFTGSKYAGIVSTIIYFCGVLVNKAIVAASATRLQKLFASLLPQVALMQGASVFANYEGTGVGLNSSTSSVTYMNYSFNTALGMLLFDFALFFLLGLYLDKVIPSDFGQRLNPCFLCMPSYYRCCRRQPRQRSQVRDADSEDLLGDGDHTFEVDQMPAQNYEAAPAICKRLESSGDFLRIENLQKTFQGGFWAVRGVNVKMYESQIFALLGHNGAGKTTVISMLTGLIDRSEGRAHCFDVDLFERMDEVREFMGVCPQHDVLFDLLTPREHLDIFYDFKGGDPTRKQQQIDSLIADVGLSIDQNKVACTLSGGNKRKLSVTIALCGNSKLVLLDEPTSGMDLGARRNLWDMLKSYKKDKIIILTTHYMDEADVLGDRIGIMVRGELKCIGSSLFLKNRFGIGYKLTFVKKNRKAHAGLEQFLAENFQGVQKAGEVHEEISFVIPKTQAQNFGDFFEALDQRLDQFEVRSYGVSMSNLEDVFLKINQEFAPELFGDLKAFSPNKKVNASRLSSSAGDWAARQSNEPKQITEEPSQVESSSEDSAEAFEVQDDGQNLIRGSSCVRSCTASGAKRFIIYKRDWCGLLCQIVIPLTLVLFGLYLQSGPIKITQSPPRPLSTGFYPKQRILMNNQTVNPVGDEFDVSGEELFAMLPNGTDAFEVKYVDGLNYSSFYDAVFEHRNDLPLYPYRYGSYQIYQANTKSNLFNIVQYLNVTSQDATAMFPQYMYQAILRVATGDPDLEFNVINYPFPVYQKYIDIQQAAGAYDFVFMTAIALALIPCVMVQFILQERQLQLKHQQLLSGMSLAGYWTSNLFFDVMMAYIPTGFIILLTFLFNVGFEGIWVLFLLFPPAVVPFTYVTSFLFTSDINAQIMTLFIHFVGGGLLVVVVFVLQYIPITMKYGDALRWACTVIPSFCVTHGILFSASGTLLVDQRTQSSSSSSDTVVIPRQIPEEIWAWYNLKGDAAILVLHFVFGLVVLALIELEVVQFFDWCPLLGCRSCKQKQHRGPELIKDDDVIAEEERVAAQTANRQTYVETHNSLIEQTGLGREAGHIDCIRVHNFQKEYTSAFKAPVKAVQQASFGLDFGECFALLGVNGAGKSTTFKSLTREITPTTGEITIQGYDVQRQFSEARKLIGYCPQYDAIFPKLTVEETLKFYALIKGIRTHKIQTVVEKAIRELNLKDHRKKLAGTLSGGNKRKLSVAMALLGNPPIILLDEPSAGMDPEARRFMWQVVEKISQRDKKSAVILTTHSMEEAEALSTKLGIMVRGGVFRCMGSTQHIKNKFGVGYEVEIKVRKAQHLELQEMATDLGFQADLQAKVPLQFAVQQLADAKFDELILEQIKKDGLGSDIVFEAELEDQHLVRLRNLIEFLKAQQIGLGIVKFLTRHFEKVEILEHCGEFFKLRVPRQDKTIGWLFGELEHEKRSLGIQEYSISQTTLEQIFQNFANQSIASDKAAFTFVADGEKMVLLNPNHRMTARKESTALLIQPNSSKNLLIEPEHQMENRASDDRLIMPPAIVDDEQN